MKIYIKIFSTTVSLSTDVSKKTLKQLVLEVGLVANTPRGGWGWCGLHRSLMLVVLNDHLVELGIQSMI